MKKILYLLKNTFHYLLSYIAPIRCEVCNTENLNDIEVDIHLCDSCKKLLQKSDAPDLGGIIERKHSRHIIVASSYTDANIKKLIRGLKYSRREACAYPLALLLSNKIKEYCSLYTIDLTQVILIPIPLHKRRMLERGFNQSACIAKHISKILGTTTCDEGILRRTRSTQPQASLSQTERKTNVTDVFECIQNLDENKYYILIDDVITTGATTDDAARCMKYINQKAAIIIAAVAHE